MKPKTKKEMFLSEKIKDLDSAFPNPADARLKRQEKKILKKARNKHTRNQQRRELRDNINGR